MTAEGATETATAAVVAVDDLADLGRAHAAVLRWFEHERRDLPFRRTRDPYLILVSEAMAQQTQIGRVAEAWTRFTARFPTVRSLADAPLDEVLRAWAGLGYNRRAVHLHRAARSIVRDHGGLVPSDPAVLETLPGVGPYTARAVAAIAFGHPVAAVDTNVRRVLRRLVGRDLDSKALQALADRLVPAAHAADWTAALMDVGARHCRPVPRCDGCPLRPWCATGSTSAPPVRARRATRRAATEPPFASTSRWLRGRIVERLREVPGGAWLGLDQPIGSHDAGAVRAALVALEAEGIVELDRTSPARARLARD